VTRWARPWRSTSRLGRGGRADRPVRVHLSAGHGRGALPVRAEGADPDQDGLAGQDPEGAGPKLFIHSPQDEVVPYELGRRLYEAAGEPKRFLDIPGASHNDMDVVGGHVYFDALARFLAECRQRAEGRVLR